MVYRFSSKQIEKIHKNLVFRSISFQFSHTETLQNFCNVVTNFLVFDLYFSSARMCRIPNSTGRELQHQQESLGFNEMIIGEYLSEIGRVEYYSLIHRLVVAIQKNYWIPIGGKDPNGLDLTILQ